MPLEIVRRDARRSALTGLIDYAGLFPPASLDLEAAVAEYREARAGGHGWLVDRFVCPAGRLVDLARVLITTMPAGESPWRVAVTATLADARTVKDFGSEMGRAATVAVVEVPLPAGWGEGDVVGVLEAFPHVVHLEIPHGDDPGSALARLAAVRTATGRRLGAKVRTGGAVAAAFPSPEWVADVLLAAADHRLPVKATAGLHHPVRHHDPATGFTRHGFLNLLAAAALAAAGAGREEVVGAMAETDPAAFALTAGGLSWRGHHVGPDALAALRQDGFVGYGSCSIEEPAGDLTALGILPVGP